LGVTGVCSVGWGGAGREDLCAELRDGVVADEDTGLVLGERKWLVSFNGDWKDLHHRGSHGLQRQPAWG
jgi:hypothetical protein